MTVHRKEKEALLEAVENNLGRGKGTDWTNYDFELLSEDIFGKTGKQLSVSTLKRVWNRTSTNNQPSVSTLNILAEYTGFADWTKFSIAHRSSTKVDFKPGMRRLAVGALLLILVFSLYGFYLMGGKTVVTEAENEKIQFTLKKVTEGYPNTVIFEYDIGDIPYDSLAIQQSWDKTRRISLDKPKGMVTSTYYYPGYFLAKLVVNDQIVKEKDLYIPTHGWQGIMIDAEENYVYIDKQIHVKDGSIRFDSVDSPEKGSVYMLANLLPEPVLDSKNFKLTAKYRSGENADHSICKFTGLIITGTEEVISFEQGLKGCVGDLNAFINGDMFFGKETDLSGFALADDGTSEIVVEVVDFELTFSINGKKAFSHTMKKDFGLIGGVQLYFQDPGEINELIISDKNHHWDILRDPYFKNDRIP